ncbi:3-mercaptopyruvate sulfurtransferase [Sphingomonas sp. Leaf339]|uniref:sulfurtransferase n=1 Tax=Sphingomonas sp. Leaf339 TaxID=1736343 RepID=UPI0006FE105A|nr:sulfurtransferase [Sphingomonas sp. Leaf339]KQU48179.1 3-mercaptopyruvate sulfurtransferase [Sphingomonas sp. Leaf339]
MDSLVTTDWLAEALGAPDLIVVDATLLDASLGRDARAEFEAGHIPGTVFLDLAILRDTASSLPNMLPDAAKVAAHLSALGIGDGKRIVLYDASPWRTAARAWWLIRSYGIGDVAILDGGIAKWRAEHHPLAIGSATPTPHPATPSFNEARLRDMAQVRANLASGAEQLIDARSPARFTGDEGDPHGAAPGHIPGSRNITYGRLFTADGTWKQGDALAVEFADLDLDAPIVATCGSGVTAAVLAFGVHLLGREAAIYDGSWSEWGRDPSTPKATGTA